MPIRRENWNIVTVVRTCWTMYMKTWYVSVVDSYVKSLNSTQLNALSKSQGNVLYTFLPITIRRTHCCCKRCCNSYFTLLTLNSTERTHCCVSKAIRATLWPNTRTYSVYLTGGLLALEYESTAAGLTNQWDVCPKWYVERFPWNAAFTAVRNFNFFFRTASLYCEEYVHICPCLTVYRLYMNYLATK